jgi:hypothetical protein
MWDEFKIKKVFSLQVQLLLKDKIFRNVDPEIFVQRLGFFQLITTLKVISYWVIPTRYLDSFCRISYNYFFSEKCNLVSLINRVNHSWAQGIISGVTIFKKVTCRNIKTWRGTVSVRRSHNVVGDICQRSVKNLFKSFCFCFDFPHESRSQISEKTLLERDISDSCDHVRRFKLVFIPCRWVFFPFEISLFRKFPWFMSTGLVNLEKFSESWTSFVSPKSTHVISQDALAILSRIAWRVDSTIQMFQVMSERWGTCLKFSESKCKPYRYWVSACQTLRVLNKFCLS